MKRISLIGSLLAAPALAHPGHGTSASNEAYWLSDPTLSVVLGLAGLVIGIGLIAVAFGRRWGRRHG